MATANLCELIRAGKLGECHQVIKNGTPINTVWGVKLVVTCCHWCCSNFQSSEKLDEVELKELLNTCVGVIEGPSESHLDAYLQSVFHILKYLLAKKSYSCIVDLEDFILPQFLPSALTDKQKQTYINIGIYLYNKAVLEFYKLKDSKFKNIAVKFSKLISSIHTKIENPSILLENARQCILTLICLNNSPQIITNYYLDTLNMVKEDNNEAPVEIFGPVIKNFEAIYVYLLKQEHLSLADSCYVATIDRLKSLPPEILQALENCRHLNPNFPAKTIEFQSSNLKRLIGSNNQKLVPVVCHLISSVTCQIQVSEKLNNLLLENLSLESLRALFKFLHEIFAISLRIPKACSCNPECSVNFSYVDSLRILSTIPDFSRAVIVNKKFEISNEFKSETMKYLEMYLEVILRLKKKNCIKWRDYATDAAFFLYSIGTNLASRGDDVAILFLKRFCQFHLTHDSGDKAYVMNALGILSDVYFAAKKFDECLTLIALTHAVSGELSKNSAARWIKVKIANRDDVALQELNFNQALLKYKEGVEFYCPQFFGEIFNKNLEVKLLINELKGYKNYWKSKLPMMVTFRELFKKVDTYTACKVFIVIWGSADIPVHKQLPKLLKNTVRKLEKESKVSQNDPKINFTMSYLYYLLHRYQVTKVITQHVEEMEKTLNLSTVEVQDFPPDPNDECDIVSSYDCLKLENYLKMIKNLEKSYEIVCTKVMVCFDNSNPELNGINLEQLYTLLSKMGHEFCLHDQLSKSLRSWQFALKVAEVLDNHNLKLQAITFLIEFSDGEKTYVQDLIAVGDEIANNSDMISVDLVTYFICKSEAYFYSDFTKAYDAFKKAQHMFESEESLKENYFVRARVNFLHHKFIMLPCSYEVEGHLEFSFVKIHLAVNDVVKHYSEAFVDAAYDIRVFFQINEALAKTYHDLRLPREVRCYSKEILTVAQNMVLPFRSAACLFYLAHADIITCRLDDARVKISGLSEILGLSNCGAPVEPQTTPKIQQFEPAVDGLAYELSEMVLDLPHRTTRPTNSGSPTFKIETFRFPAVFNHEETCECFCCSSNEFQDGVLKQTFLHGLLNVYELNAGVARDFFCGTLKLLEFLVKRGKGEIDFVPEIQDKFKQVYAMTLLEYCNVCLRARGYQEAEKINDKLVDSLENCKLKHVHLYNEALLQKLNVLRMPIEDRQSLIKSEIPQVTTEPGDDIKTPESKQSSLNTAFLSEASSPNFVSPRRPVRRIKFEIPEDDNVIVKSVNKKQTAVKKKAKKVLGDIPQPPATDNSEDIEFGSPETLAPTCSKVKLDLASKNKLLQEKLKSSSKLLEVPSVVVTDVNEAGVSGCSGNTKQLKSARKNVLKKLDFGEDSDQPVVRRSTRNRR